jgi:NAD+ diphosphatase
MLINERHAEFSLLFDPKPAQDSDITLLFKGNEVLLRAPSDTDRLPLWEEIAGAFAGISPLHAFTQSSRRFFIATAGTDAASPSGFGFENVRAFRTLRTAEDAALLSAAYHLSVWYDTHRFCGACGGPLHTLPVERALECGRCGLVVFPTILPAVIVAITDGDRLLLARSARGPWRQFSLVAGYVEAGETTEQTVRREVLEEVGLRVKNIRYVASQPWGVSQSLMLGFSAELDGDPTIRLQESELSEARWFGRDEIPAFDSMASIASDLMERFRRGLLGGQD